MTFISLSFYFTRNLQLCCLWFTFRLFYEDSCIHRLMPIIPNVSDSGLLACINKLILEIGYPRVTAILNLSIWIIRTILGRNYMGFFTHEGRA